MLQNFNARILYLAQCKIDGIRPCGGLGFANELKEIMFEEEAKVLWFILATILLHTSYISLIYIRHYMINFKSNTNPY